MTKQETPESSVITVEGSTMTPLLDMSRRSNNNNVNTTPSTIDNTRSTRNPPTATPVVEHVIYEAETYSPSWNKNKSRGTSKATASAPPAPNALRIDSRRPVVLTHCPECQHQGVRTTTRTYPAAVTWVLVGVGAIVFWPLCWIPLVADGCKQTDHTCSQCGKAVGRLKPLEDCCVKEMA